MKTYWSDSFLHYEKSRGDKREMTEPLVSFRFKTLHLPYKATKWLSSAVRQTYTLLCLTVITWSSLSLAFIFIPLAVTYYICAAMKLKRPFTSSSHCDLYPPLPLTLPTCSHMSSVQATKTGCGLKFLTQIFRKYWRNGAIKEKWIFRKEESECDCGISAYKWRWVRLLYTRDVWLVD